MSLQLFRCILLIGIWGSGPKEYSAMKLTLMLMGGSALLLVGILGIYFNSAPDGGKLTFNILEISKVSIPIVCSEIIFSAYICRIWCSWCIISFSYMVARWSCFCSHCSIDATCRSLMKLGGYGAFRVAIFLMPEAAMNYHGYLSYLLQ